MPAALEKTSCCILRKNKNPCQVSLTWHGDFENGIKGRGRYYLQLLSREAQLQITPFIASLWI